MLRVCFSVFVVICAYLTVSTDIEDKLETEIDTRVPSSFHTHQMLSIRSEGFTELVEKGNVKTIAPRRVNWEKFAHDYWYETRYPVNAECPQIPSGIAVHADWALQVPCLFGNVSKPPDIIFVHTFMLPHFVESTLNFMDKNFRFVLVTGGVDGTVPRNALDVRFPCLRNFCGPGAHFQSLVNSPKLIHWYAENRDMSHAKMSTIPTGMGIMKGADDRSDYPDEIPPLMERPLKVMLADRVRDGRGQWYDRAMVLELCKKSAVCSQPNDGKQFSLGTSHRDFLAHLTQLPFIACVHGGGIDPSPKAWEAMVLGTIPIIMQSEYTIDAYARFPLVMVRDFNEAFGPNATANLRRWRDELAPHYEPGTSLRAELLHKLRSSYWIDEMHTRVRQYKAGKPNIIANVTYYAVNFDRSRVGQGNSIPTDAGRSSFLRRVA